MKFQAGDIIFRRSTTGNFNCYRRVLGVDVTTNSYRLSIISSRPDLIQDLHAAAVLSTIIDTTYKRLYDPIDTLIEAVCGER